MGLTLHDPIKTDPENWIESCVITEHLVTALRGQEKLQKADHTACLRQGRAEVRKQNILRGEKSLAETLAGVPDQVAHRLQRTTKTGAWLKFHTSKVSNGEMPSSFDMS